MSRPHFAGEEPQTAAGGRLRSQEAGESLFSLGSHGTHQPHLPPHRKHFILVPIRLNKAADAFFYLSMKISFWTSYKILLIGDLIYSSSLSFALYFCLSFCLVSYEFPFKCGGGCGQDIIRASYSSLLAEHMVVRTRREALAEPMPLRVSQVDEMGTDELTERCPFSERRRSHFAYNNYVRERRCGGAAWRAYA